MIELTPIPHGLYLVVHVHYVLATLAGIVAVALIWKLPHRKLRPPSA